MTNAQIQTEAARALSAVYAKGGAWCRDTIEDDKGESIFEIVDGLSYEADLNGLVALARQLDSAYDYLTGC
jgi:hypothetical protein